MKILHYVGSYAPAWSYGGPPRSVSALCEALAAAGHAVTVLATDAGLADRPEIPRGREVERNGVRVTYFPAGDTRAIERAAAERLRDCDVFHSTGVWQPVVNRLAEAARRAGVPHVVSPRGALSRYSFGHKAWKKWPFHWFADRPMLNAAQALHFTARAEQQECERLGLRPRGFVVPNAIDPAAWRRDETAGRAWRAAAGIGEDEFVFLYTGRLHPKKGLDLLAPVAVRLSESSRWRFVLVGFDEAGTAARLRSTFADLGLGGRLWIGGGVAERELAAVYSAADRFVFPSLNENFGNNVVEALACGCPATIAEDVGVRTELDGLGGVTVLPRETGRWAVELAAALGAGRGATRADGAAVLARFAPAAIAARMTAVYAAAGAAAPSLST